MTRLLFAVAACLAMLGAAYGIGRHHGTAALQARMDAAQVKADQEAAHDARDLAIDEQRRRATGTIAEDAAREDPAANPSVLPAGRLRRINAAIAAANGPVPKP